MEPLQVGFTEDGVNKVGKLWRAKSPAPTHRQALDQCGRTGVERGRSNRDKRGALDQHYHSHHQHLPTVITGGFEEWAIPAAVPHPSLIRLAFFGEDGLVFTESLAARIGLLR